MKNLIVVFVTLILAVTGYSAQEDSTKTSLSSFGNGQEGVLEFYRQYSSFTDPGDYAYLYENLPDSLPELCRLIRSQFIHLYAELPKYRDRIPKERWEEFVKYPKVKSILEGLVSYDSRGLVKDRKPEDRLVLICRHNAILLASVLKYRGIPARARCGHVTYLIPDFHTSHVICEVWNEKDRRWMLVDPSMDKIDFSKEQFDFSNDAWLQMQNGEIDPNLYGIPGRYSGMGSLLAKLCADLAYILGAEYTTTQYPPILDYVFEQRGPLPAEDIETLNRISELMKSLNADNLKELQDIYNNTPRIQITKSFDPKAKKAENDTNTKNISIKKPNIEFVDVPGGTFMMGSPDDEEGRKDDEIQHEVTLSDFKMSKTPVTYQQYDAFCEITGRKKPQGYPRGNRPVTMVTWHDANEFAKWMGCRLPTEAEFEYAARANTKTPFNTGEGITADQANFNGEKPYKNCGKGKNRKKTTDVGSFAPNAFGLSDMHGNIWEWTNDWYGEYDVEDKLNPKGPDKGQRKVDRGGGFYDPAWRCRSACRGGGTPAGNKGIGIGFRLVKDQ